jgi:predicted nucleic acid-binding Zn ribbon protein
MSTLQDILDKQEKRRKLKKRTICTKGIVALIIIGAILVTVIVWLATMGKGTPVAIIVRNISKNL